MFAEPNNNYVRNYATRSVYNDKINDKMSVFDSFEDASIYNGAFS